MTTQTLTLALIISLFAITEAWANCVSGAIDCGTCNQEETCLWKLDANGQLTIYAKEGYSRVATDDYTDFKDPLTGEYTSNAPWNSGFERAQRIKSVVVDDKVSSIGNGAFEFNRNLKSAYMPGVENLGIGAFYYTDLTSIDMPKILSIGAFAFQGNDNLTYVNMLEGVEIGRYAFSSIQRDFTQDGYPIISGWYDIINLNECTISGGQKVCGICNGYVMSGLGCVTDCGLGYKGENGLCVAQTCAEMYPNSSENQCENSVSGCSVTTCTEVGTLVDGETKCYTSATVDHTPSCGSNASVVGSGTECSCQCNSGYSGDGTTCTMLTCEDLGKMSSCSDSIVGCEKTTCSEDGTLADSSVCYTATVEDITPSCDTYASLNQQSCNCSCNEGYEGDGETCQAISCSAGQYLDGSECKQCAAGSYAAAGDNHCSACADGAYSAAGAGSCSPRQNTDNCSEYAVDSDTCTGCNSGYHVNNGACLLTCPDEQVLYKGECLDEYPFAKKHYTPAEANKWLKDDDNTITLLFKK